MTTSQIKGVAQEFQLGEINQIAFVVKNIDQVLPFYEAIFGSFHVLKIDSQEVTYRGKIIHPPIKTALGKSGSVEIELCEAVGGGPPHGDFLKNHGEGLYHVRFKVDCLQEKLDAMRASGFVDYYGGDTRSVRFAYLEPPEEFGRVIIELIEWKAD